MNKTPNIYKRIKVLLFLLAILCTLNIQGVYATEYPPMPKDKGAQEAIKTRIYAIDFNDAFDTITKYFIDSNMGVETADKKLGKIISKDIIFKGENEPEWSKQFKKDDDEDYFKFKTEGIIKVTANIEPLGNTLTKVKLYISGRGKAIFVGKEANLKDDNIIRPHNYRGLFSRIDKMLNDNRELAAIKTDLSGMNDKDIEDYFNQCIANKRIFIYKGGFANTLLIDSRDWDFAKSFQTFSMRCTNGTRQAIKFNQLMLDYIREHLKKET